MRTVQPSLWTVVLAVILPWCAPAQTNPGAAILTYPVTLEACYRQTLEGDPEIQQARCEVDKAAGTRILFESRALPRLTVRAYAGGAAGDLYTEGGPFAIVKGEAAQPLFEVGIPAALRRGKLEVVLAQQTLNRVATERLHRARLAYLRLLLAREELGLRRAIESRLAANARSEQQRFETGSTGKRAARQAEVLLLNHQATVIEAEGAERAAATELAGFLGQSVRSGSQPRLPEAAGRLEYAPLEFDPQTEAPAALARRPDLALLRDLIRAAREEQRMAEAGYFPAVELTAFGQYIPSKRSDLYSRYPQIVPNRDPRGTEALFGAAFTWKVVDNGTVRGASRRLASGRQACEILLRQLEEAIPRELEALAGTARTLAARAAALRQSAAQAGAVLDLAEQRLGLGLGTQLEFHKAQADLLAIRSGLAQTVFENEAARASLDRITGRYLAFAANPGR